MTVITQNLKFDPNKPSTKNGVFWATWCAGRSPEFKLHSNRGSALNGLSHHSHNDAILYKWNEIDNRWDAHFVWDKRPFRGWNSPTPAICDHCGSQTQTVTNVWADKKTDFPRLLRVCSSCRGAFR